MARRARNKSGQFTRRRKPSRRRSSTKSRRRTVSRRTTAPRKATAKRRTRRRSTMSSRLINPKVLKTAGAAAGGFAASQFIVGRIPGPLTATNFGRAGTKVALGLATAKFGRRFVGADTANGLAVGMAASGILDLIAAVRGATGLGDMGADLTGAVSPMSLPDRNPIKLSDPVNARVA